jgi:hypothetical protein
VLRKPWSERESGEKGEKREKRERQIEEALCGFLFKGRV